MFKNATLYQLPTDNTIGKLLFDAIDPLKSVELQPVGTAELRSSGFVPVANDGRLAMQQPSIDAVLLQLGTEERVIPAATLRAAIRERINAYREKMGRTPGKRARDQLKDEVLQELLPRAFVKPGRCYAYLDLSAGLLVVDSASDKPGELICGKLRDALGSFAAETVFAGNPVTVTLTRWLLGTEHAAANLLPYTGEHGFTLGDDVEIKDWLNPRAVVRVRKHDLGLDEIRELAKVGGKVTAMGLVFDGRVSFTLDESLKLRKIKFTDVVTESLTDVSFTDAQMLLEAQFALMVLEMRRVFAAMRTVFGMV